jgi:putative membrane protein
VTDVGSPGTTAERPFFGRPYNWLLFALALLAVPLVGYMLQSGMDWESMHPAINAMLNGSSTVFLTAGYVAIRRKNVELHRLCMVSAFSASTLFLASYLARFAISGTHRYPGEGWDKILYLAILFSHMLLAAAVVPLVLRALYLAWRGRFEAHRRVARWTWPIWMYVSVTGVVVYLMLYPIANALYR